jgi:hypothetical protein
MSEPAPPSVDRIAGQLRYLLDERPELRTASAERLRDRLNLEDRYARARAGHPTATDESVRRRAGELEDRIPLDVVRDALHTVTGEAVRSGRVRTAVRDDTPRWLFLAALALWTAGLIGWIVNLAVDGPGRPTWTGGALLVAMGAAIGGAFASHREGRAA